MRKNPGGRVSKESPNAEPTPPAGVGPHHYVAIGASAGGLEAIEAFFTHMPAGSGLTFIVIQHLSPDYKSLMVELLTKKTPMPVFRAEEGMQALPNAVYLIPPKQNLRIFHGKLLLTEQDHVRGINLPIDIFMRSLAEDQAERAVGIILSGTGSDGMRGVRAIKENGGMIMVQDEESAKFDGMPRSAQSTGMADFVLPPDQMPAQLLAFVNYPILAKPDRAEVLLSEEDRIAHVFSILRERCKVDFTYYKPSTVMRRIERRMTINQQPTLQEYVAFLQHHPAEAMALYRELLIGVTSFFRDAQVWEALAKGPLRDLLMESEGQQIRFWVPACSTGEETYTLAILVRECMEELALRRDVKIFATDVDQDAIHFAAAGSYPESIAADVSGRLLAKYFFKREENFQISRPIREMVVFAKHNLIKDPPFTRISLVSCRNLLIYFQPVLQRKVLDAFSFSLGAGGVLMLGTSETTGEASENWEVLDAKLKLYRATGHARPLHDLASGSMPTDTRARDLRGRFSSLKRSLRPPEDERVLERFVEALSPDFIPLVLIANEQMEVLHTLGDTEGFFRLPAGKLVNDITRMATKELSIPLATGIQKAFRLGKELRYSNIRIPYGTGTRTVEMQIRPLPKKKHQEPLVAVFLGEVRRTEHVEGAAAPLSYDLSREAEDRMRDLEQDLQFTRENLQATIEELETSNEELQATNEELLASNEELQSTNEELQSTNEELYTVNTEFQSRIIELTMLHNDVENLLSASQVGTLLLDENLEVRRFSPVATKVFKLVDGDIGRPLTHIAHFLRDCDAAKLIRQAQDLGCSCEHEVQTEHGEWFLLRATPYMVGPEASSGTVVSLIDISRRKRADEALWANEEKHRKLFDNLAQGVVYQDAAGVITAANPAAEQILGLTRDQLLGVTSMDPRWRALREDGTDLPGEVHPAMVALRTGHPVTDFLMGIQRPDRPSRVWITVSAIPQVDAATGSALSVCVSFQDVTLRMEATQALRERETTFRQLFNELPLGYSLNEVLLDADGVPCDYIIREVNPAFERHTGLRASEIVGRRAKEVMPGLEASWVACFCQVALTGEPAEIRGPSQDLGRFYQVKAICPQPGFFALLFSEATES